MDWDKEETIEFIDLYRSFEVLWYPRHPEYFNKISKQEAWVELGEKTGIPVDEMKKKMETLLSGLRREKMKMAISKKQKGANNIYKSSWYAFESLKFLLDKNKPRKTISDTIPAEDLDNDTTSETKPQASNMPDVPRPVNTKRNIFKRKEEENNEEDEAYNVTQFAATQLTAEKDEADLFGQMVAAKIRKLTPRNRAIAENQIQNFLFDLQMQEMDFLTPQQLPQLTFNPPDST